MPEEKKINSEASKTDNIIKKQAETTSDFETWFPPVKFINTIEGDRIDIPVVSAGKEAKVFQALARLIEKLPKKVNWENLNAADLIELAPKLLKEAPEEGFFIASILLSDKNNSRDPKWIQDNLDFDTIFALILPFVAREAKLFNKVSGLFGKLSPLANF